MVATWALQKIRNGKQYLPILNTSIPSKEDFDKFMFFAIVWTVVGARLGHIIFFDLEYYIHHLHEVILIRYGGLSFHGSVLALALYTYYFCKKNVVYWKIILDVLCLAGALGIGIGRLANFVNQELYGKVCTSDFAVIFTLVDQLPRYPTQLFESFFEGFLNFWLLIIIFRLKGLVIIGTGMLTSIFCIVYSSARFVIEFYKEVETITYFKCLSLTVGQILSLALFFFGIFVVHYQKYQNKHSDNGAK
jgi:phosphatidylglycerol:prolipoprotein diacylglycerol transferase